MKSNEHKHKVNKWITKLTIISHEYNDQLYKMLKNTRILHIQLGIIFLFTITYFDISKRTKVHYDNAESKKGIWNLKKGKP